MTSTDLHKKLEGSNSLACLKEWLDAVKKAKDSSVLIKEFFKEPQNKTHLLKLFNKDKLDSFTAAKLFEVINTLLSEISQNVNDLEGEGIFLIQHLVRRHSGKLRQLVNHGIGPDSIVGLEFLTNSALIGPLAANDVLSNVQWKLIDFIKVSKKVVGKSTDAVRQAILKLAHAYLTIEDTDCLCQFLKLPNPMSCVMAGLSTNKALDVVKLVKVLHENVLQNESVPKVLKRRFFKDAKAHYLLMLYTTPNKVWNGYETKMVVSAVHELMKTLCTSSKHGIVEKENNDIFLMFKNKLSIMKTVEGVELVAGVIASCPDIRQSLMSLFKTKLNSNSDESHPVMNLLTEVFENDTPWVTEDGKYEETNIEKSLSYVPYSNVTKCLNDTSPLRQLTGQRILKAVFDKGQEALLKIEELGKETETKILQDTLIKCFAKHQTHLKIVSKNWASFCESENTSCTVDVRLDLLVSSSKIFENYCMIHDSRYALELVNVTGKLSQLNEIPTECKKDPRLFNCLASLLTCLEKCQEYIGFMLIKAMHFEMDVEKTPLYQILRIYQMVNKELPGARNLKNRILKLFSSSLTVNDVHLTISEAQPWLEKVSGKNATTYLKFIVTIVFETIKNLRHYKEKIHQLEIDSGMETELDFDLTRVNMEAVVEDSEDICVLQSAPPFSLLVLSATDYLHRNKEKNLCTYFTSVMSEYVYSLSTPEVPARFLLLDEAILSKSTIEVLQSFLGLNAKKTSPFEVSFSDTLSNAFRAEKCPHFSKFRPNMDNVSDSADLLALVRQLILYIKREHNCSFKTKRPAHLKFFCKVLREFMKILKLDPTCDDENSIVQFLLTVPFLLDNYNPFSDEKNPNPINHVAKSLLHLAFMCPAHHGLMRPYFEKLLSHFLCIETFGELKVLKLFEAFIPSDIYTYTELQDMTFHGAKLCVDVNVDSASLLCLFVKSLKNGISKTQCPSLEVMEQLINKRDWLIDASTEESEKTLKIIEELCIEVLSSSMEDGLKDDLCKLLMSCDNLGLEVKLCLVKRKDFFCTGLVKQWRRADQKPSLESEAPVVAALTTKIGDKSDVHKMAKYYKQDVLNWVSNNDSNNCDDRQTLLNYLLKKGDISKSEAASICTEWFDKITSEMCSLPQHIVSLRDLFEQCGSPQRKELLLIFVNGVRKVYRKDSVNHDRFLSLAPQIISDLFMKDEAGLEDSFYNAKSFWPGFVKQVLRMSLSDSENGSKFLDCLSLLCKRIFTNGSKSPITPGNMLEKLLSHSLYLPTLLQTKGHTESVKESLVKFQQTLIELDDSLCEKNHIPVLLGAYGATLSSCDQAIYKLLFTYEKVGCRTTYPPVLWGSGAVSHFALEATVINNIGAFRAPTAPQIFHIIEAAKVLETAFNFDSELDFEPTPRPFDPTIYDQRHLLLVFNHVCSLATVQMKKDLLFSNFIALALSALTSSVQRVWAVGANILKKIHSLLMVLPENKMRNSKEKNSQKHLLWVWLIEITRNSLRGKRQPLPTVTSHFLIRTAEVIKNPSNPAFKSVMHQIFQQPTLRLGEVPGLYKLLFNVQNPPVPENVTFAMSLLKTGIKSTNDWKFCLRNMVPKYLFSLLKSEISSIDVKNGILEALISMSHIESGAKFLIEDSALTVILQKVLANTKISCDDESMLHLQKNMASILLSLWKYSVNHSSSPAKILLGKRRRTDSGQNSSKRRKTSSTKSVPSESEPQETSEISEHEYCLILLGQFATMVPILKKLNKPEETIAQMVQEVQNGPESCHSEPVCAKIQSIWSRA